MLGQHLEYKNFPPPNLIKLKSATSLQAKQQFQRRLRESAQMATATTSAGATATVLPNAGQMH